MADVQYTLLPPDADWETVMELALDEARAAQTHGEVPIGAVLVDPDKRVLARGGNRTITDSDPTAHAEIVALRRACQSVGNYRLPGAILAVTLEPCLMCLGALIQARLAGVVFAARDPKAGAIVSQLEGPHLPWLNHRFWVRETTAHAATSRALLQDFFRQRRGKA
ncbi:nucleoside deaminase [Desulfohalobium retbaense]|uniref:tRNA-specific adenosine deaminase n=1 Tax=Desulfohalobium retbaense (strain ATCC 49708 / DSM 5692 / JCM 16813 / HR100) TaxID=485915 RepID=C8X396_DESRD|nr:nucleoside deaminase [Desulfohalobium retbaense]ACV68893.1 CMP/dCMP deaminase zinc-binding protein [Desulfohalobium retbaense DSM 5692]